MKKIFVLILFVFISCDEVQYGESNNLGKTYYFNSKSTDNSNLGTKEKPFKSLDYLEEIELYNGDKILLSNGSTFLNTIELINEEGIEISNYDSDGNSELPIINSKGKIAAIFIENSSNIEIRNLEIPCEFYPNPTKIKKQMNYANERSIPFVILIGPEEIKKDVFVVKDMNSGNQSEHSISSIVPTLEELFQSL